MNTAQDFLNLILAAGFLIIIVCIVYVAYYLVQTLKSVNRLTNSLEDTAQGVKETLRLRAVAAIPALLAAIIGRIIKRGR